MEADLSTLPREFLEAYPYPAFVLQVPVPPPASNFTHDDPASSPGEGSSSAIPFSHLRGVLDNWQVCWANERWHNLIGGKELLDCLDLKGAQSFGDWLSGAKAARRRHREKQKDVENSVKQPAEVRPGMFELLHRNSEREVESALSNAAPEGFWELENPPYEDRSIASDPASAAGSEAGTGISLTTASGRSAAASILIELVQPGKVTLELTRTFLPCYRRGKHGSTMIGTYSFAIILCTPRSPLVSSASAVTPPEVETSPMGPPPPSLSEPAEVSPTSLRLYNLPTPNIASTSQLRSDEVKTMIATPVQELESFSLTSPSLAVIKPPKDTEQTNVKLLLETFNWAETPLGPRETWNDSLNTILSVIMDHPDPACLWYGPDLTLIYNQHYAGISVKHPDMFGMAGARAWAELWNDIGPLSAEVLRGRVICKNDDLLLFRTIVEGKGEGRTVETYHSWMWLPVHGPSGSVDGLFNSTRDTTAKVLAERRLSTVRAIGERCSIARTMDEFDAGIIESLTDNPVDVPFALLYHAEPVQNTSSKISLNQDRTTFSSSVHARLVGTVGVPAGHPSATSTNFTLPSPRESLVARSNVAFRQSSPMSTSSVGGATMASINDEDMPGSSAEFWPLREALVTRRPVFVSDCSSLIAGYPLRHWDALPESAIVIPIMNDSAGDAPPVLLVLGLNLRRPFDEDYEGFCHLLRAQLAAGVAAVRSFEAERARLDEMAALDKARTKMYSTISHETKTPLSMILLAADDMLGQEPAGPRKHLMTTIRRNAARISRLVDSLMDVSKLEAGRLQGSFRPMPLGTYTRDLAALFRTAIERGGVTYEVTCDTNGVVYVDEAYWEKIVCNLISNAAKYTISGFIKVSLSFTTTEAVLTVADSGVGIPLSDIPQIGQLYHRVASVSRSHEGTGIGLSLCKELIRLHGGTLELVSRVAEESADGSHGSTFTCRIPLGTAHLPPDVIDLSNTAGRTTGHGKGVAEEVHQWYKGDAESVDSSSESGSAGISTGDSSKSSRGIDPSTLYFTKEDVILVVDDNYDLRRYVKSIFVSFCVVLEARNGQEALDICRSRKVDLVLSDVMMPIMDGLQMLSALRGDPDLKLIPVILLTARGGDENRVEGLLAGAEDYLAKPFSAKEVLARAHMQLQMGKRRMLLERLFQERSAELRLLTEYAPVGIFRSTADGSISYANPAFYSMSGTTALTATWEDHVMPEHVRHIKSAWDAVMHERHVSVEFQWQATGIWVAAQFVRLNESGLDGVLVYQSDITARKSHEKEQALSVEDANRRRIAAEEEKSAQLLLMEISSHELRSPLAVVLNGSILCRTNLANLRTELQGLFEPSRFDARWLPSEKTLKDLGEDIDTLDAIASVCLSQESICNDILSLGRLQMDLLPIVPVEVDLQQGAQEILNIFRNEAKTKGIELVVTVDDTIRSLKAIKIDFSRLKQTITNLVINSLRLTASSAVRKVIISFEASFQAPVDSCTKPPFAVEPSTIVDDMPLYLFIAVQDTGPGLSEEDLRRLFLKFSQVTPKNHSILGGSGLGLFICRKLTELMGGRIEVVSSQGPEDHGSTFRFYVRALTAQTTKRQNDDVVSEVPAKKRIAAPSAPLDLHILVVEDNKINQTVLVRQFRNLGVTCRTADNGLQALEMLRKTASIYAPEGKPFDCVLMDLEMPVMDGLTAVRTIRQEEAQGLLKRSIVIALTGNAGQGQIDQALREGMDDVVIKPYRINILVSTIEQEMAKRSENDMALD